MNMIEILESIKEDINDDDLWFEPVSQDHGYLIKLIPENKKTLFNHLKDKKLLKVADYIGLETLGDSLLMMLDNGFPDETDYAIDEMVKYGIGPRHLYDYIMDMRHFQKEKLKKALEQYDVPFFITVTSSHEMELAKKRKVNWKQRLLRGY